MRGAQIGKKTREGIHKISCVKTAFHEGGKSLSVYEKNKTNNKRIKEGETKNRITKREVLHCFRRRGEKNE